MKRHLDKEACPACGSEEYTIDDFCDNFDLEEGSKWWRCCCNKCGCKFDVERIYKLVDISVSHAHGDN